MKSLVFKNFIINALGILFSRVLGLARDVLIALFLGAGIYSDIFFVALKMPAFFRRIFAEGAFGQSFLPNFVKAKKKGGDPETPPAAEEKSAAELEKSE